jgi:hypothetical protein
MHTVLLALLIVGTSVGLALLGMWLVRRRVLIASLEAHTEVAGFVYAVVGVVYSVLLAFVVVAVWQEHSDALKDAEAEASAIVNLSRMSGVFTLEDGQRVRTALLIYTDTALGEGWAALEAGSLHEPAALNDAAEEVWRAYLLAVPEGVRGGAVYSQSLGNIDAARDARRRMHGAAVGTLPPVLWAVLLVTGVLTVGFTFLFGVRSARAQAAMTTLLAAAIGLELLLIVALDNPFAGDAALHPTALQTARERIAADLRSPPMAPATAPAGPRP